MFRRDGQRSPELYFLLPPNAGSPLLFTLEKSSLVKRLASWNAPSNPKLPTGTACLKNLSRPSTLLRFSHPWNIQYIMP